MYVIDTLIGEYGGGYDPPVSTCFIGRTGKRADVVIKANPPFTIDDAGLFRFMQVSESLSQVEPQWRRYAHMLRAAAVMTQSVYE